MIAERVVAFFLRLFPRRFRARFEDGIRDTVRDARRASPHASAWGRGIFLARLVVTDLVPTLIRAWLARAGDAVFNRPPAGDGFWRAGLHDVRLAARTLVRQPAFTVVTVSTLAVGIGANASIFSVVNGVLLKPLPYADPSALVNVWQVNTGWYDSPNPALRSWADEFPGSMPVVNDWIEHGRMFEAVGAYDDAEFTLIDGDVPRRHFGSRMMAGTWRALGVAPLLGRTFVDADDRMGTPPVVVLSHQFWQQHFGGDSTVVGRTLRLNGSPHTIVGVMPAEFYFPSPGRAMWTNFTDDERTRPRGSQWLKTVARLRPGIDIEAADRELQSVNAGIQERLGDAHPYGVRLVSRMELVVGDARGVLMVFLGAVVMVLLVACANIASLLLVRVFGRERELAIRTALGAGRGRLVRHILTESLVLSAVGGMAGLALAWSTFGVLTRTLPRGVPRQGDVQLDLTVVAFTLGLTVLTGLLVGSVPAWRAAQGRVGDALGEGARGSTAGRRRNLLQGGLVVSEVAITFVLLTGAGLLVTSFVRLTSVDRGFDSTGVLTASARLTGERYESVEAREAFHRDLAERLAGTPGVTSVAFADNLPFSGGTSSGTTTVETEQGTEETNVQLSRVDGGYFTAMGIPITAGRAFDVADARGGEPVVVISQGMARRYWGEASPVGWRVKRGSVDSDNPWLRVVGVAADVRHRGLHIDPSPKLYTMFEANVPERFRAIVKVATEPDRATPLVRAAVGAADPGLPETTVDVLERLVGRSVSEPRFRTVLLSLLAGVAALLAIIGIYGVLAYSMSQRTAELGIRVALGATAGDVVRGVLRHGAALAGLGIVIGLAISLAAVQLVEGFLYETAPYDPRLYAASAASLGLAALAASVLPARRAVRVDPVEALRAE